MHYLSTMTEEQTLVMYSGHPMGLFPSSPSSPRVVITNGMASIFLVMIFNLITHHLNLCILNFHQPEQCFVRGSKFLNPLMRGCPSILSEIYLKKSNHFTRDLKWTKRKKPCFMSCFVDKMMQIVCSIWKTNSKEFY